MSEGRTSFRKDFTGEVRTALLEGDVDELFRVIEGIRQELRNTNRILMGLLVSISTAAVLLAVNVAVGSIK